MAFLPLILILVLMWALLIRPQQRRAREHQAVVALLRVGDEVMTTAGMFGTVSSLDDEAVSLEIAPGVVVRVLKASIVRRLTDDGYEEEPADGYDDADHPEPEEHAPDPEEHAD
jgi:preprotein translocase subunit YajC